MKEERWGVGRDNVKMRENEGMRGVKTKEEPSPDTTLETSEVSLFSPTTLRMLFRVRIHCRTFPAVFSFAVMLLP